MQLVASSIRVILKKRQHPDLAGMQSTHDSVHFSHRSPQIEFGKGESFAPMIPCQ